MKNWAIVDIEYLFFSFFFFFFPSPNYRSINQSSIGFYRGCTRVNRRYHEVTRAMCHRFGRIKKLLAYNYIERRMCLVIDYLLVLSRSTVFQNRSLHIYYSRNLFIRSDRNVDRYVLRVLKFFLKRETV